MTSYQHIKVPAEGQKITVNADMSLNVPDQPIIPFIEGDGTGADITPVMLKVVDAAVAKAYGVAGSGLGGLLRSVVKVSERVTFIIDEQGRISHVIDDPNCPDHGVEVLAAL